MIGLLNETIHHSPVKPSCSFEKIFLPSSRLGVISSSDGQGRPQWRHWWWTCDALSRWTLAPTSVVRLVPQHPCLCSCLDLGCGFLVLRGPVSYSGCSQHPTLWYFPNLYYDVTQKHACHTRVHGVSFLQSFGMFLQSFPQMSPCLSNITGITVLALNLVHHTSLV